MMYFPLFLGEGLRYPEISAPPRLYLGEGWHSGPSGGFIPPSRAWRGGIRKGYPGGYPVSALERGVPPDIHTPPKIPLFLKTLEMGHPMGIPVEYDYPSVGPSLIWRRGYPGGYLPVEEKKYPGGGYWYPGLRLYLGEGVFQITDLQFYFKFLLIFYKV